MQEKDLYAPILRNWIYPLAQRMMGRNFPPTMNAALSDQHLKSKDLRDLQLNKLRALIQHAFQTVPYYQKVLREEGINPEDINTLEDFKHIPILSKETLRENSELFYSTKPDSTLYPATTSGSTGMPLKIMVSQRAALRANISRIRSLEWWGIRLGDREIRLTNTGFSFNRGWRKFCTENLINPMRNTLMNRKQFSAYSMTQKLLRKHWEAILKFRPRYLFGFPSAYTVFANYLHEEGFDGKTANLKMILTSGETLYESQQEFIATTFGCNVADEYGSIEMGAIAHSHPCGVMHTMDDGVFVEVIKSNPGDEFGELVVTNLDNWSYPIIRYNLDDLAKNVRIGHECPIGLGLGVLEGLVGRKLDMIRLVSGRIIYNHYFQNLIKGVRGVKQYQVIQKKPDYFVIKIVPHIESFDIAQEKYIQKMVYKHLEGSKINIKIVDNIQRDPSGKLRFVKTEL